MSKTLLFCLCLVPATLFAQDQQSKEWKYKGEVSGSLGVGQFYHGDDALGKGPDLAVAFGFRPFSGALRGLGFEVLGNFCAFKNQWGNGYSHDGQMHTISGNALYHFGRSRTQFYVVGGIGMLTADYVSINPYTRELSGDPNQVETAKASKMATNFGAGVKTRITSRLSLRPEVRIFDTTIGKGYNWSHIRISIGLGYHF
jgi:opacity protein-like surface antigen